MGSWAGLPGGAEARACLEPSFCLQPGWLAGHGKYTLQKNNINTKGGVFNSIVAESGLQDNLKIQQFRIGSTVSMA